LSGIVYLQEGNKPAKFDILGLVDHAHSAATEFFPDAVMRYGSTDQ
jgi:hypothetical protein